MNKENIEPKNLIEGNVYVIDAKFNNSGNVRLIKKGKLISTVQDLHSGIEWETMTNRLSEIKATQPPAISSNEGETVEVTNVQEGKTLAHLITEAAFSCYVDTDDDYCIKITLDDLNKTINEWQASQSQHSYTEAGLKAAWQAGNDFGNECHCGECDYCIDVKYGETQPFDVWVKTYPKQVAPIYSTDEVLAIIEQVKEKVTEAFMSDKSITDIDFKYLLK